MVSESPSLGAPSGIGCTSGCIEYNQSCSTYAGLTLGQAHVLAKEDYINLRDMLHTASLKIVSTSLRGFKLMVNNGRSLP